jgi:hypothetical protein
MTPGWSPLRSVTLDQLDHHTISGLKNHGQRRHIKQRQVLNHGEAPVGEDNGLHSDVEGNGLIRIDGAVRPLSG